MPSRLALLAMLVHLLSPAGYMPVSLSAGLWLTVCPDGLPAGWLDAPHGHGPGHDHVDDDAGVQLGLDECPIGSAVGAPSLVSGDGSIIPPSIRKIFAVSARLPARSQTGFSALARAPPDPIPS